MDDDHARALVARRQQASANSFTTVPLYHGRSIFEGFRFREGESHASILKELNRSLHPQGVKGGTRRSWHRAAGNTRVLWLCKRARCGQQRNQANDKAPNSRRSKQEEQVDCTFRFVLELDADADRWFVLEMCAQHEKHLPKDTMATLLSAEQRDTIRSWRIDAGMSTSAMCALLSKAGVLTTQQNILNAVRSGDPRPIGSSDSDKMLIVMLTDKDTIGYYYSYHYYYYYYYYYYHYYYYYY
jgi:hypothetical protein